MLDAMSCTECGRCQDVCPAYATGKALSPKLLIMGIRDQLFAEGPDGAGRRSSSSPLVPNAVTDDVVWDCVTCGACVQRVPGLDRARRPHRRPAPPARDGRLALPRRGGDDAARRRALAATRGASRRPSEPPGRTGSACASSSRATPAPEVLYWVGCAASFDERARIDRRLDDEAAARRRARRRHPRPARVVHRRPGPADGERVHLPVVRPARTSAR